MTSKNYLSSTVISVLSKEMKSLGRSLFQSTAKKTIKDLIFKPKVKSPAQIDQEIIDRLGFSTTQFSIDKSQKVSFKGGPILLREYLNQSPSIAGKILRDEETGTYFYSGKPFSNSKKMEILERFSKQTGIKSTALSSHLDQALKLFDPVDLTAMKFKEHFKGWKATNPSVIDTWMERCFGEGIATDLPLVNMMWRKWIIGAAKRIINPGSSLDGCISFVGGPGLGKTQFGRQLLPPPFESRSGEILCSIKSQVKFVEAMLGKSICTFDELAILRESKIEEMFKTLLTAQHISVRLPYRRDPARFALRCGFLATTNESKFIKDPALSRRLWVIELNGKTRLDFKFLQDNREALWKEALFWAEQGEESFLSPDEQTQVEAHNQKYLLDI